MAEKLLPCPFCGADVKYNEKLEAVFCHGCDAMRTGYKHKRGSAISEWNRRSPDLRAGIDNIIEDFSGPLTGEDAVDIVDRLQQL